MTSNEAYNILVRSDKSKIFMTCSSCLDFGTFFVFSLRPMGDESDVYFSGTVFDAVDKKTGRVFAYDITSDLDAYDTAKSVPVETFLDRPYSSIGGVD